MSNSTHKKQSRTEAENGARRNTTRLITAAEKDLLVGSPATTAALNDQEVTPMADNLTGSAIAEEPTSGAEEVITTDCANNSSAAPAPTDNTAPASQSQDSLIEALEQLERGSAKRRHNQKQEPGNRPFKALLTPAYWQQLNNDNLTMTRLFLELKGKRLARVSSGSCSRRPRRPFLAGIYGRAVASARHLKLAERLHTLNATLQSKGITLQPPTAASKRQRVFQSRAESWQELEKLAAALSRHLKLHPAQLAQANELIREYERLETLALFHSYRALLGELSRRATTLTDHVTNTVQYWRSLADTTQAIVEWLDNCGDENGADEDKESNIGGGSHRQNHEDAVAKQRNNSTNKAIAIEFRRQHRACLAIVSLLEASQTKRAARRIRGYLDQGWWDKLSQGWIIFWWFVTMLVLAAIVMGSLWVLWATITNFSSFWTYMTV